MALPILDGNQSATTLSSILTSGEHIPAHTVVSLGTQAITDISGAVSGSVVSISNFPATQPVSIASVTIGNTVTIAGTVTANPTGTQTIAGTVTANVFGKDPQGSNLYQIPVISYDEGVEPSGLVVPVQITNGGGTLNSNNPLPISGTVTANLASVVTSDSFWGTEAIKVTGGNGYGIDIAGVDSAGNRAIFDEGGGIPVYPRDNVAGGPSFPISGTVTANISLSSNYVRITDSNGDDIFLNNGNLPISGTVTVGNSVTISSLPAISGTVTATIRNGEDAILNDAPSGYTVIRALSHWFDDVVDNEIKNTSQTNPLPISGTVTVGNSVTIGSLPAISGTVTANTFALQGTAVTTSNFTSTTASTVLAGYNATREVLTIFNEGAGNLHVCAGATCTTIAYQVRLSAGDYYEVPNHQTTITHSAVFATAGTARVTEVS